MSPRRNRSRDAARPGSPSSDRADRYGLELTDSWQGEEWAVRHLSGAAAAKHYRCPGCDQAIPPGVPHLVAWPREGDGDDRRHWHKACWNARDRRGARLQRSRQAPRY